MDVCEAEVQLENLNQHRIEQSGTSICSLVTDVAVVTNTQIPVSGSPDSATASSQNDTVSHNYCLASVKNRSTEQQQQQHMTANDLEAAGAEITTTDDSLSGDDTALNVSQDELSDSDNGMCQKQQSPLSLTTANNSSHNAKSEMLTADESLSSDDATLDISQNSLECYKNEDERHRQSIAISPDATSMTGCSTTEDSLSSDETALDLSQNSAESTKCLSDLESVSVSSIVRRTTAFSTGGDYIDDDLTRRRVSFPMKDSDLVTGYMEPANPWESASSITSTTDLIERYKRSCLKHKTVPLDCILEHLKLLELEKTARHSCLNLKEKHLSAEDCEPLEEILKTVQYQLIDLTACNLNDSAASALFDMFEYYESVVELNVSQNQKISTAGWQACVSMIRKSDALQTIILRGNPLSESYATNLGKALNASNLHTLKLEHCGLTGRPLASLCNILRKNTVLKELWLAYNDLYCYDADKIADLLKANLHLQFLDVSNNNLKDAGVKSIAIALIEQSTQLSFTSKRYESQAKLKTIEFPISITKPIEEPLNESKPIIECEIIKNSVNGSRSMLDALLQMQPGECIAPVQSTTNNNIYDKTIENKNHVQSDRNSLTEKTDIDLSIDSVVPLKEPPPLVLPPSAAVNSKEGDIEITVNYASEASPVSEHEIKTLTNNNTLKSIEINNSSAQSPNVEIATNHYMNENKGIRCRSDETLLIDIDDGSNGSSDGGGGKILQKSPSYSPMLSTSRTQFSDDSGSFRSQSCDSLNSDTSLDAIGSLSDEIKAKITKNDTLGRQKSNQTESIIDTFKIPRGLQALILWDNKVTRLSAECISDMIASTNSLELLNIGKNTLCNDFIATISNSLRYNRSLTNLGLQSSHLNSVGIKKLADVLQFGGNSTLERIDLRDNNIQVEGLMALCDALKSNKSIMQIDLDDEPKRIEDDDNAQFHYSKYLHAARSLFAKNRAGFELPKVRSSRKISLTCQSIHAPVLSVIDIKKKSGTRLRSPLPSPPTVSPSSSPVPSPSRASRFQVSRVQENGKNCTTLSPRLESPHSARDSPPRSSPSPTSRFRVTVIKTEDLKDNLAKTDTMKKDCNSKDNTKLGPTKNSTSAIQFVFPEIKEPISDCVPSSTTVKSAENPMPERAKTIENTSETNDVVKLETVEEMKPETMEETKFTPKSEGSEDIRPKPKTETRIRKSSWNTNQAVERFINLFHNPSAIFKSSNSNDSDSFSDVLIHNSAIEENRNQSHMAIIPTESGATKTQSFLDAASKQFKGLTDLGKHVLRPSPPMNQSQQQQQQLPVVSSASLTRQTDDELMSSQPNVTAPETREIIDLNRPELTSSSISAKIVEIKENISPEHTINSVHAEILSADKKLLKLETQAVELDGNKENSESPLPPPSVPLATTHGNDRNEI